MPLLEEWEQEEKSFSLERTSIAFLKGFAWLDLFCGILGALIIWMKFSSTKISSGLFNPTTETVTNPVAIGVGFAVLLQGLFAWAFFLVVAYMATNLIMIRDNTATSLQSKT